MEGYCMVYALKTHRLTTRKPAKDRFLTCQIHPSSEGKEGYCGCLFSLIEIENNQYSNTQIGHSIINTVAREYYRLQNNNNCSDNFELALKKTNELLADYTQEGKTDWIGNIHGIITLIYKDEIHFTCVGSPKALLIRNGKLSSIIPKNNENDIHPLCTFSNITSGVLDKNDIVVLSSKDLFTNIEKKDLRQLLELNSLEDASVELAHHLSEQKQFDNVILIETTTKEDIANEPLTNVPDTIYLDEVVDSPTRKINLVLKRKFIPAMQTIFHHIWKASGSFYKKSSLGLKRFYLSKFKKDNEGTDSYDYPDQASRSSIKVNYYNKLKLAFPKIPLYPAIIALLLIFLIISVFIKFKPDTTKQSTKPTSNIQKNSNLSNLQTKFSLAKSAQSKEAIKLLQEIIDNLNSQNNLDTASNDLLKQSKQKFSSLTNTKYVQLPKDSITLPAKNSQIFSLNDTIYAFSPNGTIYKKTLNQAKFTQIFQLNTKTYGNIKFTTGPVLNKFFYIYTINKKLLKFSTETPSVIVLQSTDGWKSANDLSYYGQNIYLTDDSQIWKYTPATKSNTYNKSVGYINPPNAKIKDIQSITINGTVYALIKKGQIYKILKTSQTIIPYSKFPSPDLVPKDPFKIKSDDNNLFVISPQQIVIMDPSGKYVSQIYPEKFNISDISIQSASKKIWITTTTNRLFSYNY